MGQNRYYLFKEITAQSSLMHQKENGDCSVLWQGSSCSSLYVRGQLFPLSRSKPSFTMWRILEILNSWQRSMWIQAIVLDSGREIGIADLRLHQVAWKVLSWVGKFRISHFCFQQHANWCTAGVPFISGNNCLWQLIARGRGVLWVNCAHKIGQDKLNCHDLSRTQLNFQIFFRSEQK